MRLAHPCVPFLFVLLFSVALPAIGAAVSVEPLRSERRPVPRALERSPQNPRGGASKTKVIASPDHQCVGMDLACGQTVDGTLTDHDCPLDDGTFVDFWFFQGTAGETVTIDLESNQFDSFLFLLDPAPVVVATDDDGGPGTDARIVFDLDQSGEWSIGANNVVPGPLGGYTLSLACGDSGPPPGGPVAAPSNLTAVPFSPTEVELRWRDNADNETLFAVEMAFPGEAFEEVGVLDADSVGAIVTSLPPDTELRFRVRAENEAEVSPYSNVASTRTFVAVGDECVPTDVVLCLNDDRFQVQVSWRTDAGTTGRARAVPGAQSDDSGVLFFFDQQNWEMLLKVLTGCPVNDHYWVFFAATTTVEVNVHVGDTSTGEEALYFNPLGQRADAVTDTEAFATCP